MEELNSADRQWQLDARNEELDRCNKILEKASNRAQGTSIPLPVVISLLVGMQDLIH